MPLNMETIVRHKSECGRRPYGRCNVSHHTVWSQRSSLCREAACSSSATGVPPARTSSMWAFLAAARLLAAAAASRAAASAPCRASLFGERRRSRSLLGQSHKVGASMGEHPQRAARHSATDAGTAVLSCDDVETLSQHAGRLLIGRCVRICCVVRCSALGVSPPHAFDTAGELAPRFKADSAVRVRACILHLLLYHTGKASGKARQRRSARLVIVTTSACVGRGARCMGVRGAAAPAPPPLGAALLGDSRAASTALTLLTQRYLRQELRLLLSIDRQARGEVAQAGRAVKGALPRNERLSLAFYFSKS